MPAAEYPANVLAGDVEEPHPTFPDSTSSLITYHIKKTHHHSHLKLHISSVDTPPNTIAPSYTTTPLSFLPLPAVPPSFDLLLANNNKSQNHDAAATTTNTSVDDIKAATRANLTFHAHLHGVEMKIDFLSQTDIPPSLGAETSPPPLPSAICKSNWTNRTYEFELPGYSKCVWKGTTTYKDALPNTSTTTEGGGDGTTSGRGNLKLLDPCGKLVAVWRNMTDSEDLGVLTVDTSGCIGCALEVKLEECVATCVAVVMVERLQYKGWVWGLGKEKARE